jgi:hypothetical protein
MIALAISVLDRPVVFVIPTNAVAGRRRFGSAIAAVGKCLLIAPLLCAKGLRINHDAGATCQSGSATMICCL